MSNISFETSDCDIALEGAQRDRKNVKAAGKGCCDRKKGTYAFEEYLRPRKGSGKKRNFMLWKESIALEDGFKGAK